METQSGTIEEILHVGKKRADGQTYVHIIASDRRGRCHEWLLSAERARELLNRVYTLVAENPVSSGS